MDVAPLLHKKYIPIFLLYLFLSSPLKKKKIEYIIMVYNPSETFTDIQQNQPISSNSKT